MKYAEMLAVAAEKLGHCRVAGGLTDEDMARQVLEAIGMVEEPEPKAADDKVKGKK